MTDSIHTSTIQTQTPIDDDNASMHFVNAASRWGAPGTGEARIRWWLQETGGSAAADTLRTRALSEQPVRTIVRDVLDYFAKCPLCGYPAQAFATVRTFGSGRVETSIQPTCGLPCGWQGPAKELAQAPTFAERGSLAWVRSVPGPTGVRSSDR